MLEVEFAFRVWCYAAALMDREELCDEMRATYAVTIREWEAERLTYASTAEVVALRRERDDAQRDLAVANRTLDGARRDRDREARARDAAVRERDDEAQAHDAALRERDDLVRERDALRAQLARVQRPRSEAAAVHYSTTLPTAHFRRCTKRWIAHLQNRRAAVTEDLALLKYD